MEKKFARIGLTVLIALVMAVSLVGTVFANDLHGSHVGASSLTFKQECNGGEGLAEGQVLWHFIHTDTNGENLPASITATFQTAGSITVAGYSNGNGKAVVMYDIVTNGDDVLLGASDTIVNDGLLNLSHVCRNPKKDYEKLTVSKTVETFYTRTHDWSIAKAVDPAAIYLYIPGQGASKPSSGTATWTVDVTYGGYVDSGFHISGNITIKNAGTLDAVITDVTDFLAPVDCGVAFPYTLGVGNTLSCTYSADGKIEGINEVTVTTERASYGASAAIVWGDPTTEINKTVTVKDISGLFGEQILGAVTAPNNGHFTYSKTFNWADFGDAKCGNHTYNNTATIVETGASASAALTVYVQCHIYETAYAKGNSPTCFIPTFSNWGWTNYIATKPTVQTWNLWAGAGQCDTNKGTLVGTVTVNYGASGYVIVTYNVSLPYVIKETHVYAGATKFPMVKIGKQLAATVAPGQYTNVGPFSGSIYVIAHAVVGLPDPNFGP